MQVDIPEPDANRLRKLCGLEDFDAIPDKLEREYWMLKRLSDRTGDAVTPSELKLLCHKLGYGKPLDREANPTVVDLFRAGKLPRESAVQIWFRNSWRDGILKNVNGVGEVIVQIDGDPDERKMEANKVRVAELAAA